MNAIRRQNFSNPNEDEATNDFTLRILAWLKKNFVLAGAGLAALLYCLYTFAIAPAPAKAGNLTTQMQQDSQHITRAMDFLNADAPLKRELQQWFLPEWQAHTQKDPVRPFKTDEIDRLFKRLQKQMEGKKWQKFLKEFNATGDPHLRLLMLQAAAGNCDGGVKDLLTLFAQNGSITDLQWCYYAYFARLWCPLLEQDEEFKQQTEKKGCGDIFPLW